MSGFALAVLASCRPAAPSAPVPGSQSTEADASFALYLATVTAAELSLRLHETDRALYWLDQAPSNERAWEWRYLRAQADQSTMTTPVGRGAITDITPSPDGRLLAVGTGSGTTLLMDVMTGAITTTLEGHTAAVWTPVFSSDGRRLATVSSDGTARIWDVSAAKQLTVLPGNGLGVAAAAWSPDDRELAVSSWDRTAERGVWGTLNIWDPATGERLQHIEHGGYPIASLAYTHDGAQVIGGTWDWNLLFWDARTWSGPVVVPPPESPYYKRINDFALSPDGRRLAVAYADGRARIWDVDRREVVRTLETTAEGVIKPLNDVVYLSEDRIATVGGDLTLRLWDAGTGAQLALFHGAERPINTVAASRDGRRLYTGGGEGEVQVWDMAMLDPARSVWRVPHTVYSLAFDPTERQAVVGTWQGWLRIIDTESGDEIRAWEGHERAAVGVDWSEDGRWIASTGSDGRVVVWEPSTGRRIMELQDVDTQLESLAFGPGASLLAAPTGGTEVRVWRIPSGEPLTALSAGGATVSAVTWSGEGLLAATSDDGKLRIWEVEAGTLRATVDAGTSGTPTIAFHPSGDRIAIALGRLVRIWDLRRQSWSASFSLRSSGVARLDYSMDGRRLAAALSDNTFELWDAGNGDVVLRLPGAATAWSVGWTRRDELILIPLDQTVRVLRAPHSAASR